MQKEVAPGFRFPQGENSLFGDFDVDRARS
jgi:hypothetical protein